MSTPTVYLVWGVYKPHQARYRVIAHDVTAEHNPLHEIPAGARFCPICGEQLLSTDRQYFLEEHDFLQVYYAGVGHIIIGACIEELGGDRFFKEVEIIKNADHRLKVAGELENLGLLDDTIGFYLVWSE